MYFSKCIWRFDNGWWWNIKYTSAKCSQDRSMLIALHCDSLLHRVMESFAILIFTFLDERNRLRFRQNWRCLTIMVVGGVAWADITVRTITDDWEFLVMACDGIWDVMTNAEVVEFVRNRFAQHLDARRVRTNYKTPKTPILQIKKAYLNILIITIICIYWNCSHNLR